MIRVTISAGDCNVTVENNAANANLDKTAAKAASLWRRAHGDAPRHTATPPALHAGGMGFSAELGPDAA